MNFNVIPLIPSYQPDNKLIIYIDELIKNGFKKILVVNDGSSINCKKYFDIIKEKEDLKKLVNEIRVEYMDKIPPIVDIGEMSKSIAWVDEPISLLVTISDNESGVDIEKCMWEYNTEPNLIGEDESLYTGGIFTKEIEEIE